MVARSRNRQQSHGRMASLQDAADELSVSVTTLRRRIADGTLRAYRVGRMIRVDVEEMHRDLMVEIPTVRRWV